MEPQEKLLALKLLKNMPEIDCYRFAQEWQRVYETHIDWHEFSFLLDYLHSCKLITLSGFGRDGQTQYKLNS